MDAVSPLLEWLAVLVEDSARLAANAIALVDATTTPGELGIPPLLLLRHGACQALGIASVTRSGLAEPAEPLARSVLETMFGIECMLQHDTERRVRAYWVCDWHRQLEAHERHDPATPKGAQFRAAMSRDHIVGKFGESLDSGKLRGAAAAKRRLLGRPEYAGAEAEWQRLSKGGKRAPSWYSFWGGPRNMADLAEHVKGPAVYRFLYSRYSERIHAGNALAAMQSRDGRAVLRHLYDPTGIENVVAPTVAHLIRAARLVVREYGSESDRKALLKLYAESIRPGVLKLAQPGTRVWNAGPR